jgi:hypothetical protein
MTQIVFKNTGQPLFSQPCMTYMVVSLVAKNGLDLFLQPFVTVAIISNGGGFFKSFLPFAY